MTAADRCRGCMLGLAVGDALGYPVEFDRSPRVSSMTSPLYSDDTQMAIATAEGILKGGSTGDVHRAYRTWLRSQQDPRQRRAPGGTCLSALASGRAGTMEEHINTSKGCGGVMRAAPAGLAFAPGTAFRKGADYAAITHGHPSGYLSAGVLAETVSRLAEGSALDRAVDEAAGLLPRFKGHEETLHAVREAGRLAGDPGQARSDIESLGGGWVGEEALAIAVYCALRFQDDFAAAVLASVNHAGDSDSTGCICGAILGTLLGPGAIPAAWRESVEGARYLGILAKELAAGPRWSGGRGTD